MSPWMPSLSKGKLEVEEEDIRGREVEDEDLGLGEEEVVDLKVRMGIETGQLNTAGCAK